MLSSSTFVVVVISLLQIYGEACHSCNKKTQFECRNGDCKPKSNVCDGVQDCTKGEDEGDCSCEDEPPRIANMASYKVYPGSNRDYAPYYVQYECETGYTLEGSSPRCIRRRWSDERPTCVGCEGEPPPIENMASYKVYRENALYSSSPYPLGAEFLYECKAGYTLEGSSPRCIGRRWSNERPTCVGCEDEPPAIANMASYKVYNGSNLDTAPYYVGSKVQYECKTGYTLEGSGPRCIKRRWSDERPTCLEMCQNEPPSIDHMAGYKVYQKALVLGQRFSDSDAPYENGSFVEYVCDFNYKPEGLTLRCINGRWSGRVPRCVVDFATCGQAGEIGKNTVFSDLGRVHGSHSAAKNAWPWQVLITKRSSNMTTSLSNDNVGGGGSIINSQWILTAAHVLSYDGNWCDYHALLAFVGISKRPGKDGVVESTIEAYAIEKCVRHNDFSDWTFDNDIALIKVGARLNFDLTEKRRTNDGLTFQRHIRPVCLPCSSLKTEHPVDENLALPLSDWMNELLLNSSARVVVTGFGLVNQSDTPGYKESIAEELQQGLLKIEDKATCRNGINGIKGLHRNKFKQLQFTENMICFSSGMNGTNTDACEGDSGGPVVQWLECPVVNGDKKTNQFRWVQIGIVSFGYGCGSGFPGYYTNVARYISWINDATDGAFQGHIFCKDGFFYGGRCYFTVMKNYRRSSAAKSLCSSNEGRLADILDKHHQMLVAADVREKMSTDYPYLYIGTGMKYQHSNSTVRLTDGSQIDASTFQWVRAYPIGNHVNVKLWIHEEKSNDYNGLSNYDYPGAFGVLCRK